MSKSPKRPNLTPKFDPIWRIDFGDLHKISPYAFIIRQLLRLARNLETNLTDLSDVQIQIETGLNRETIRRARRELISAGYIIPHGYHTYFIRPFKWTLDVQPSGNHLDVRRPTDERQTSNHLDVRRPTDECQTSNPIVIQKQNNTETEGQIVYTPVKDDEITALKMLYPHFEDRERLKNMLLMRGLAEFEIGKVFERVYPQQYTGKEL